MYSKDQNEAYDMKVSLAQLNIQTITLMAETQVILQCLVDAGVLTPEQVLEKRKYVLSQPKYGKTIMDLSETITTLENEQKELNEFSTTFMDILKGKEVSKEDKDKLYGMLGSFMNKEGDDKK